MFCKSKVLDAWKVTSYLSCELKIIKHIQEKCRLWKTCLRLAVRTKVQIVTKCIGDTFWSCTDKARLFKLGGHWRICLNPQVDISLMGFWISVSTNCIQCRVITARYTLQDMVCHAHFSKICIISAFVILQFSCRWSPFCIVSAHIVKKQHHSRI